MEETKKVIIHDAKEVDMELIEDSLYKIKETLLNKKAFCKEQKEVINNAIKAIEDETVSFYKGGSSSEAQLLKDILDNKIELIISRDEKTFKKIGNDIRISAIIASNCPVYTLDGRINTISNMDRLQFKVLGNMYDYYKIEADRRSKIGEMFKTKDVRIWNLSKLNQRDTTHIKEKADAKEKKYIKDRKKGTFFQELCEKIDKNAIMEIRIDEIANILEDNDMNCIITKDRSLQTAIEKSNDYITKRILYNKNVVICSIINDDVRFFMMTSVKSCTRDGFEKYNKKISKEYVYKEL